MPPRKKNKQKSAEEEEDDPFSEKETPRQPPPADETLTIERNLDVPEQVAKAQKLQTLLLLTYERRLERGTLSDTGLAALQRLLDANGWSLDPARIPQSLKDKLTSKVSAKDLDGLDGILPLRKKG